MPTNPADSRTPDAPRGEFEQQIEAASVRSAETWLEDIDRLYPSVSSSAPSGEGMPIPCSVCLGSGRPLSQKPCICGGIGTEQAEMDGLRRHAFALEDEVERKDAEIARLTRERDEAVQVEREACADLASAMLGRNCSCELGEPFEPTCLAFNEACKQIESAIRARSSSPPGATTSRSPLTERAQTNG